MYILASNSHICVVSYAEVQTC